MRLPRTASATSAGGAGSDQRASNTSSSSSTRPSTTGASWRRMVSTSGSSGIYTREYSARTAFPPERNSRGSLSLGFWGALRLVRVPDGYVQLGGRDEVAWLVHVWPAVGIKDLV